jgi:hypothetical protein
MMLVGICGVWCRSLTCRSHHRGEVWLRLRRFKPPATFTLSLIVWLPKGVELATKGDLLVCGSCRLNVCGTGSRKTAGGSAPLSCVTGVYMGIPYKACCWGIEPFWFKCPARTVCG